METKKSAWIALFAKPQLPPILILPPQNKGGCFGRKATFWPPNLAKIQNFVPGQTKAARFLRRAALLKMEDWKVFQVFKKGY